MRTTRFAALMFVGAASLAIALALAWTPGGPAMAQESDQARIVVDSATVAEGETGSVPLRIENVTHPNGLGAFSVQLTFDTELIEITEITAGEQPFEAYFFGDPYPEFGMAIVEGYQLESKEEGPRGDITIAHIGFQTTGSPGSSASIDIDTSMIVEPLDGDLIPHTTQAGKVTIVGEGTPTPSATATPEPTPTPVELTPDQPVRLRVSASSEWEVVTDGGDLLRVPEASLTTDAFFQLLVVTDDAPQGAGGLSLGSRVLDISITDSEGNEIDDPTIANPAEICLAYAADDAQQAGGAENLLLAHFTGDAWEDVTTQVDTESQRVCGETTSFSMFAVAYDEPAGTPTSTPTPSPTETPSPTAQPDDTPSPTATNTPTPEPTATATATPTPTPSPDPGETHTPTAVPASPEPTASPTPTPMGDTPTPQPTSTPSPTVVPSPGLPATGGPTPGAGLVTGIMAAGAAAIVAGLYLLRRRA